MAAYQEPKVTRDSVLQDYMRTLDDWKLNYRKSGTDHNSATDSMAAFNRLGKLKELLSGGMLDSGAEESGVNPFSVGGSGGAPTMPTENRFASGLSDAETRLRSLLDNPDSVQQSAAYKFRVGQGQEALQRSLGAKGMLNSGNRLMELTKYGQDMGSQEYDAQYGRLGSLLGNYSQGYTADRNANTNQFAAQSNAWNQAQGNADRNRLGFAQLAWDKQKGGGGVVSRSSGGMTVPNGTLGGIGGTWDPEKDPGIARLRQSSIDAYNY